MNQLLLLFGFLASLEATASIRIVRGGGLAEMLSISIHQNLNQQIRICVQNQNLCRLSTKDLQEYQNLYQNHDRIARSLQLSFVPRFQNPKQIYARTQSGIALSSKLLYNNQGQALEFKNLLALMIALRLEIQGSLNSFQTNFITAQNIWKQMQQQHQAIRASGLSSLLLVHTYQFSFMNQDQQSIYIEDKNKTYDLSEYVARQLPCGELKSWKFQQWQTRNSGNQIFYIANAVSSCAQGRPSLIIRLELDSQEHIKGSSLKIEFRY